MRIAIQISNSDLDPESRNGYRKENNKFEFHIEFYVIFGDCRNFWG
jgi:hypothetical protein